MGIYLLLVELEPRLLLDSTVLKCLRGHLEVRSSLWRAQRGFYVQYGEILALNPRGKSQKITDEQIRPIVRLKKEGE